MVSSSEIRVSLGTEAAIAPSLPDPGTHRHPQKVATGVYITIHGHFYQPPRENPDLDAIERQPSADPFHNWNERIHHECYRPNAFARILNDRGEVVGIVNNYEYLSFNIGPTLMSWLERYDRSVYQKILEADRNSARRLDGHGNAIAQVYNHIILPLANERDKYTQIRWGIEDFRSRFRRDPEGIWLAETAVDYPTLEALVAEGIRFTILAPSQAQRCRVLPTGDSPDPDWNEVGGGQIDPTRPYRCYLKDSDGNRDESRFIDIFFYDGPISRDMGFNEVLNSSGNLAGRLGLAVHGDHRPSQLISVATDGETFGHHKGGTEKCIAYTFVEECPRRGWTVTNFAHYLSICPPTWEVELKPVTAWSCFHGVDRWQDDCGCGGGGVWHQKWRRPLRDSLNWLRDQLTDLYEDRGRGFFNDPWAARDGYIQVIRDRSDVSLDAFFATYQSRELTPGDRTDALRLLEMQRHSLLMFTSCGWFFEEISRPEGTQILRYAGRAIELAADVAGVELEAEFLEKLALAPSNVECFGTGDQVYRQLVISDRISPEQVAAHYAISSLFTTHEREQQLYSYTTRQFDYQIQRLGSLTLAVGQVLLVSDITRAEHHYTFAVLHLGGWDFHCCIQPFTGRRSYVDLKQHLFDALRDASAASVILAMVAEFGNQSFSLENLFAEDRQRIMALLCQETLTRLDQLYTQVYRDNYGVMTAFHRDELPVPQELRVAAEIALGNRCLRALQALEAEGGDGHLNENYLTELEAIAAEVRQQRVAIANPDIRTILERSVVRSLDSILQHSDPATVETHIGHLERLIRIGSQLDVSPNLQKAQELYFQYLETQIVPLCVGWLQHRDRAIASETEDNGETSQWELPTLRKLLQLGQTLTIDVHAWLSQLT